MDKLFNWLYRFIKELIIVLFFLLPVFLVLILWVSILNNLYHYTLILKTVGVYVNLILTSWPAVSLIIGLFFLKTHETDIGYFVKNRMTKFGPAGVEGATMGDLRDQQKNIEEEGRDFPITETQLITEDDNIPLVDVVNNQKVIISNLSKNLSFEQIFNLIFGSQIRLLELLRKKGLDGLSYEEVAAYFEETKEKFWINLPKEKWWNLEKYLTFLNNSKLIEKIYVGDNIKYKITTNGLDFLGYIEGTGYHSKMTPTL